ISAFAIEFEMSYTENGFLEDGRFPEGISELEQLFKQYQGKLDESYQELNGLHNHIFDPNNNATTSVTVVREEKDEN
ncbi:DUF1834 family protein, partial [Glaesserella parasuis]|nr:DUF1834 family protein [Glaesserella parasuis]